MITLTNKKVGIWGFGRVGKAALTYLSQQKAHCLVYDIRPLTTDELKLLHTHQAYTYSHEELDQFLQTADYILASPGVDTAPYRDKASFICELDLFAQVWTKPSIGITGTIGKTTLTTLLNTILQKNMSVVMGGNIGTPLLDLVTHQEKADLAVIELSSWQLEYAHTYAPSIALWTNLYPNHLDRHHTMDAYFHAKANIIKQQTSTQTTVVPLDLWHQIQKLKITSHCMWVHHNKPEQHHFDHATSLLYVDSNQVVYWQNGSEQILMEAAQLPSCTFATNWLFVLATLLALKLPISLINDCSMRLEHRLEKVGTYQHLTFYNDSKATTPEATLAALNQFKQDKIILFLGGLSKGVDRSILISKLPKNITQIICFGQEAQQLKALCETYQFTTHACSDLEKAFQHATTSNTATIALFSPSGSSFDLYTNYQERGDHFKQLVSSLASK